LPQWAAATRSATIAELVPPHSLSLRPLRRPARGSHRAAQRLLAAWLLVTLGCTAALAAAGPPYLGRPVEDVLRELEGRGLTLIYSSETVPASLRVLAEPDASAPLELLQQVLEPHGLRVERVGENSFAIVRSASAGHGPSTAAAVASGPSTPVPLEEIVIAASRYTLGADMPDVQTLFTQDEIEALPRLADDALKAVHRLPGAASNGLAGLANIRGGASNETLVVFDGLPLYEPFHLRLLLSPVSMLDPRVLSGLDVHAGGYTARYGERMSAVIDARSLRPAADAYYELGLSLFHANALASQRWGNGDGQWLVAVRRSNLDEVADLVDSELGEPSYLDGFARVDYAFSTRTRGSLHALLASDHADVRNAADTEFASADYRNGYLWATVEHDFSDAIEGRAIASWTDVSSGRSGKVFDPGNTEGAVRDDRDYDVLGLNLDATWKSPRWVHAAGLELRGLSAEYKYASRVRFERGYPFPDSPALERADATYTEPSGNHVAAYLTSRVLVTPQLAAEIGLRWDEQTYGAESDSQWGPRFNLAWEARPGTRLRASWGRYQQFQGINELQVEDGVDEFQPAQVADHAIVGLEQELPAGVSLRLEAYRKDYVRLMARYESLYDPLSLVPELRWDRIRIAPDDARATGVEALLTRRTAGPWNGWLSYAWSHVEDREGGVDTRRSWDQTNSVGLGVTWASGPWRATLATTWHTGWPTTPASVVQPVDSPGSVALGPRNADRYRSYSSLDLRASRVIGLARGELELYAEVTNALNRENPCCTDFAYGYRGEQLVLAQDERNWLPLVPSVGVLWRY